MRAFSTRRFPSRRPPGPRGVPLLGMMPALRRDPTGVFLDAARRCGDVAYFRIGPHRAYLLTHPEHIRHVLQDNARNYHKSLLYDKLKVAVGNGLLTSEESYWLRQRRMAQPAFHRQRIAGLAAVMTRAADELTARDRVLAGRPPGYADLPNLPYTRMVIEEALRLYPPAWAISREAVTPDEIGGYHLPRGWLVFIIPFVMHRLPAYWEDPETFDPERFTPERTAARPKFAYLPFGAGPRQCIGNQFAMMEAHLIVATVAQRYRLELVPEHRVEPWALITLRPRNGIRMRIRRRTAAF